MSVHRRSTTPIIEEVFDESQQTNNHIHHLESVVVDKTSVDEPKAYQFMTEHPEIALIIMDDDSQDSLQPNRYSSNADSYSYTSQKTSRNGHTSTSYGFSSHPNGSHSFFSSSTTTTSSFGDGGDEEHAFFSSSDGGEINNSYFNAGHGTYKVEFPTEDRYGSDYLFFNLHRGVEIVDLDEVVDLTNESEDINEEEDDVIMMD